MTANNRNECKDAIHSLMLEFGYSEAIACLATAWLLKFGYSSKMAVLANGNPAVAAEVLDSYNTTSEEDDDNDYKYT